MQKNIQSLVFFMHPSINFQYLVLPGHGHGGSWSWVDYTLDV